MFCAAALRMSEERNKERAIFFKLKSIGVK
jgi:hypothetical protein